MLNKVDNKVDDEDVRTLIHCVSQCHEFQLPNTKKLRRAFDDSPTLVIRNPSIREYFRKYFREYFPEYYSVGNNGSVKFPVDVQIKFELNDSCINDCLKIMNLIERYLKKDLKYGIYVRRFCAYQSYKKIIVELFKDYNCYMKIEPTEHGTGTRLIYYHYPLPIETPLDHSILRGMIVCNTKQNLDEVIDEYLTYNSILRKIVDNGELFTNNAFNDHAVICGTLNLLIRYNRIEPFSACFPTILYYYTINYLKRQLRDQV